MKVKTSDGWKDVGGGSGPVSDMYVKFASNDVAFPGGVTELTFPSNLLGDMPSFRGYSSLRSLTIPEGVSGILPINAFDGCRSLETLTLPPNISGDIPRYCFYNCLLLRELELPQGLVGDIYSNAFYSCSSLRELRLPRSSNYRSIYGGAFAGCTALERLEIPDERLVTLVSTNAFTNCPAYVYVPENLVEQYKSANNWSTMAHRIFPLTE